MTTKTKITIEHVSTDELHPLYVQYDGQVTVQPTYIEFDLDSGDLSAEYSGDVGGGVPERVWDGEVVRYPIDPDLTADEINTLLDEIGPLAQQLFKERQRDFAGTISGRLVIVATDTVDPIQQLCDRQTESSGVWDAEMWIEADGMNPPLCRDHNIDGVDLRHDSTDKELDEIAKTLHGVARDEGVTLENLDRYLIDQRDEMQQMEAA